MKRFWKVQGFNGKEFFYERTIPCHYVSDQKMKEVLKVLAAKYCLSPNEIIGSYSRRGSEIRNDLLKVHDDWKSGIYSCGQDHVFTARVVDETGSHIKPKFENEI